ncbi:Gpg1p [Saccharomyces cerevisiae x Saccharomyces kudriavzevii VIN7]|uniref:Gpg1p n=1 Tax=Saccharomyces cerevisiae x Saccharomyces kudriavzevii (strain VIN7) TaxID=1095631 RepID=H0GUP8_SACCK|nr:Gpg1p [Saccharomyces cerevisiae x Saccharomyces kudriavzevii VIN7]CAI5269516.1 AIS_HP2_G0018010.mRNA.1.CDS.1 [Saccharomyces cerevisiae]CAI6504468.1 AIS_HP2_G0018010.mRNA.1.CDS.1 [Saccharomyces cerevisiae]
MLYLSDIEEVPSGNESRYNFSEVLLFSNTQENLITVVGELHTLTDRVVRYKVEPESREVTITTLPSLLALLLEKRDQAKRVYRDVLSMKMSELDWDIGELFTQLQEELTRTDDTLSMYPRRRSFH